MSIREEIERMECETLSPYATLSIHSKGRDVYEEPCDIRPVFQRDRDRILHSKAFRRLKNKTQVFLTPKGDHYRTRLSHNRCWQKTEVPVNHATSLFTKKRHTYVHTMEPLHV